MADRAYTRILQGILRQQLKPGDWLDRHQIAHDLRSSLAPVSEAIVRLTNEGFLRAVHRRGTQVRVPTLEDVQGQLLLREAIESECARLYCGKPVQTEYEYLQELAEAADIDEPSERWQADVRFHRALVDLVHCPALRAAFDRVMHLTLFQKVAVHLPYPRKHDSHVRLLEDLAHAGPLAADARIRRHMRTGKESLFPAEPVRPAAENSPAKNRS